jgi:riboflavin kinase/FMN adenylyltransferase
MKVITWNLFIQGTLLDYGDAAATIGVFDGVHVGHQKLIHDVIEQGEGYHSVIFSFRDNPALVLNREGYLGNIMGLEQRLEIFEQMGAESTVLIDFSPDLSKLSGIEFLKNINKNICLRYLAVGKNFTCGYRADTDSGTIRSVLTKQGIDVTILDPVTFENDPVSSTRIRKRIIQGDLSKAGMMLGKKFSLHLPVHVQRKSKNGMTVSRTDVSQVIPKPGDYPVMLIGRDQSLPSTIKITKTSLSWQQDEAFTTESLVFT